LPKGRAVRHPVRQSRGAYLYVLEGGRVRIDGSVITALGAAKVKGMTEIEIAADDDTELLLVDVFLL
jgi:redox-sensitive bicupin YhaK (pirin superfamily)